MGMFDKLNEKIMGGASKVIRNQIRSKIEKVVKEKRLVFLDNDEVDYTDKQGVKKTISLDDMTKILVGASGEDNLSQVGITPDMVKDMLLEERNKQKGGSNE